MVKKLMRHCRMSFLTIRGLYPSALRMHFPSTAVFFLVLFQSVVRCFCGLSGFIHHRLDAIIFLFGGLAAAEIRVVDGSCVVLRCRIEENAQAVFFLARI